MIYFFEGYALDTDRRELRHGDKLVAVEPQVFDFLQYLIANRSRVVSKSELIAVVWGGRIVSDSAVSSRTTAVRQAVGDSGDEQRLIRTIPRKGLRFVGDVREEQRSVDVAPAADVASAIPARIGDRQETVLPAVGSGLPDRRQLTIMMCDVVGSATLWAHLDSDDLREVMKVCHGSIRTIVEHYGGFLAKYATDGIVVYFGYPQAHEDDAERAVRTALAVIEAVAKLKIGCLTEPLQPRVGVATGVVLVGDSIMDGPTTVAGEAAHVAARLLTLADPGAVVISVRARDVSSQPIRLY